MSTDEKMNLGDWITTAEAARILGLTPRRIRQLVTDEDKLSHKMITSRLMVVRRSEVLALQAARG